MAENLEARFFDLLLRTLNYSIEFAKDMSYASLRFMDLFSNLLNLQPLITDLTRKEFYERLREKVKDREPIRDPAKRESVQAELLQMFIDEWRKAAPQNWS